MLGDPLGSDRAQVLQVLLVSREFLVKQLFEGVGQGRREGQLGHVLGAVGQVGLEQALVAHQLVVAAVHSHQGLVRVLRAELLLQGLLGTQVLHLLWFLLSRHLSDAGFDES